MIVYSHRGNLDGPHPATENAPGQIDRAISAGFHVEVDLRVHAKDEMRGVANELWLGHDEAQYRVSLDWIDERRERLLLHLKDFDALKYVVEKRPVWHFICHSSDLYTITSQKDVWLHDLALAPDERTIVPLITLEQLLGYEHLRVVAGVCTDFPRKVPAR